MVISMCSVEQFASLMESFPAIDLDHSFATNDGVTFQLIGINTPIRVRVVYRPVNGCLWGYSYVSDHAINTSRIPDGPIGRRGVLVDNKCATDAVREALNDFSEMYHLSVSAGLQPSKSWLTPS